MRDQTAADHRRSIEAIRAMQAHIAFELGAIDRRERVLRAIQINLDEVVRLGLAGQDNRAG